jgi:hypothetical protein
VLQPTMAHRQVGHLVTPGRKTLGENKCILDGNGAAVVPANTAFKWLLTRAGAEANSFQGLWRDNADSEPRHPPCMSLCACPSTV